VFSVFQNAARQDLLLVQLLVSVQGLDIAEPCISRNKTCAARSRQSETHQWAVSKLPLAEPSGRQNATDTPGEASVVVSAQHTDRQHRKLD